MNNARVTWGCGPTRTPLRCPWDYRHRRPFWQYDWKGVQQGEFSERWNCSLWSWGGRHLTLHFWKPSEPHTTKSDLTVCTFKTVHQDVRKYRDIMQTATTESHGTGSEWRRLPELGWEKGPDQFNLGKQSLDCQTEDEEDCMGTLCCVTMFLTGLQINRSETALWVY